MVGSCEISSHHFFVHIMEKFIRSLIKPIDCFVRRTYSVIISLQYRAIFSIVNIDNKPAILISTEQELKVYYPTNLCYYFSSNDSRALLAYKDDKIWISEERFRNGQIICQVGLGAPPKISWQKFTI